MKKVLIIGMIAGALHFGGCIALVSRMAGRDRISIFFHGTKVLLTLQTACVHV